MVLTERAHANKSLLSTQQSNYCTKHFAIKYKRRTGTSKDYGDLQVSPKSLCYITNAEKYNNDNNTREQVDTQYHITMITPENKLAHSTI